MVIHMEPPRTLSESIAREVRSSLAWHDMSQGDLAARVGLAPATLSRRLSGESAFGVGELHAVASALGMTASELLERAERATPPQAASA